MTSDTTKRIDWNWKPSRSVCFVDFETQSTVDLPDRGVWAYINDPSTRLMSAVFKVPGRKPITWVPRPLPGLKFPGMVVGEKIPEEVRKLAKSHIWVAHNAEGFDAIVWASLYPSIRPKWQDTQILAKCLNLPGSLDKLSKWFGGKGKDSVGSRAMKLLTQAKFSKGKTTYPRGTVPLWVKMLKYNVQDVTELETIYRKVVKALDHHEPALTVHSAINDRGISTDQPLAKKLVKLWSSVKRLARDNIKELTGGELTKDNIRSGPTVYKWLKKQGLVLENLRREEIALVLDDPDRLEGVEDFDQVRTVLEERGLILRTAENKLHRLLDAGGDVLRYLLTFHAAATGRFGSRGVQVHNLPSRGKADVEKLIGNLTLDTLGDDPATTLNMMLRPVFRATKGRSLGIIDFSSIEARGIAWIADQDDLIEQFAADADIYIDMASDLFGREITKDDALERQIGKIICLGCGYGMGANKFEIFCRSQRVDLAAVDLDGKTCVNAYRKKYPEIPKIWKALELAAITTVRTGRKTEAGRCVFKMEDGALVIVLPSGRPIYYQGARVEAAVPLWAKLRGQNIVKDAIFYRHPHRYDKTIYSGLIAENCVQAICRDLLVDALQRLESAGYRNVLHVHDEVVYEGDGSVEELHRAASIMSTPPEWADGFPIACEGFTNERYTKKPFGKSHRVTASGGTVTPTHSRLDQRSERRRTEQPIE